MELENIPAVVTGGASGLGLATAQLLASKGASVSIFDVNEPEGRSAAHAIGAVFQKVDVTDAASVTAGLDVGEAAHGPARILVNCAGIAPGMKTVGRENTAHSLDTYRATVEVNLIGTFNVLSQFAARLAAQPSLGEERGVIINTASVAAFHGQIGQAAYASSKAGVVGLTLPVARDLSQHLIRVAAIAPGVFLTPMVESFPKQVQDALGQQVPHPSRLGHPAEFAHMVEAIISNPMLNGEVIRLDGAIRMPPK